MCVCLGHGGAATDMLCYSCVGLSVTRGTFILTDVYVLTVCTPSTWIGHKRTQCGHCAAVVNVRDNGGTCSAFCKLQGLSCIDGW